jgi:hypothetical protein
MAEKSQITVESTAYSSCEPERHPKPEGDDIKKSCILSLVIISPHVDVRYMAITAAPAVPHSKNIAKNVDFRVDVDEIVIICVTVFIVIWSAIINDLRSGLWGDCMHVCV